mmetsp:Transcript_22944/g.56533  ORF Transcript_22944/g.56533 Transcript_22944/m.56533 type:complete len:216 (+) Transcript_22944:919-1566(+)
MSMAATWFLVTKGTNGMIIHPSPSLGIQNCLTEDGLSPHHSPQDYQISSSNQGCSVIGPWRSTLRIMRRDQLPRNTCSPWIIRCSPWIIRRRRAILVGFGSDRHDPDLIDLIGVTTRHEASKSNSTGYMAPVFRDSGIERSQRCSIAKTGSTVVAGHDPGPGPRRRRSRGRVWVGRCSRGNSHHVDCSILRESSRYDYPLLIVWSRQNTGQVSFS